MSKKLVTDLDVSGKKVLVRVDFNVPHKGNVISDDNRITSALKTINYLLKHHLLYDCLVKEVKHL